MMYALLMQNARTYVPEKVGLFSRVRQTLVDHFTIEQTHERFTKEDIYETLSQGLEQTVYINMSPAMAGRVLRNNPRYQEFLENNEGLYFSDKSGIYQITLNGMQQTGYTSFDDIPVSRMPNGPRIASIVSLLLLGFGILAGCTPKGEAPTATPEPENTKTPYQPENTANFTVSPSPTITDTPHPTHTQSPTLTPTLAALIFNYYCMPSGNAGSPGSMPSGAVQPVFSGDGFYEIQLPKGGFSVCHVDISNLPALNSGEYALEFYQGKADDVWFSVPLSYQEGTFTGFADLSHTYIINPPVKSMNTEINLVKIVNGEKTVIRTDNIRIINPFYVAQPTPAPSQGGGNDSNPGNPTQPTLPPPPPTEEEH